MARTISYREAINEALALEMERDPSVIVMGEDNAGGEGSPGEEDAWGGVLGVTKGLYGRFPGRVLDTPISESAFVGAAFFQQFKAIVDSADRRDDVVTDTAAKKCAKIGGGKCDGQCHEKSPAFTRPADCRKEMGRSGCARESNSIEGF